MPVNVSIDNILKETNVQMNPYFESLRDDTFDFDDFVETQIQFYFAVVFFNRPMAALAAKIPTSELRLEVIRNVWEEHGEGNTSLMHEKTFLAFLDRLGGCFQTSQVGLAKRLCVTAGSLWKN